jgi:tape measure domain-containing protein
MGDTNVKYTLSLNDLLTGKLAQADQQAKKFDDTMSGLQNTVNKVGAAFGIALGLQGIKNAAGAIISAGTTVENAQTGLTTLLKDAGKAKEVIANTMTDATTTPFAFEGLLNANKALISANASAEEARGTVKDLANAIAATGGGDNELERMVVNLQQIKNTGKATAMDIRQFAFAGINIYQLLADATGKPIEKVKELNVSYDLLRYALYKAHQEGGLYANGLENMANNTSVQISNLGDSMFQLSVRVFNDLKPALTQLIEVGQAGIKWLSDAWEWTKRNREMLIGLAKGVLFGVAAFKAYQLTLKLSVLWTKIQYASITLLGDGFLTENAATKLFAGGLQLLKESLLTNPIGLAVLAITGLVTAYEAFGGAAKDATRENDKMNKSLQETVDIAGQKIEQVIFQIEDKWKHGIKNINAKNGGYSLKEQTEGIAKDIAAQQQMILGNVDPIKGMDWADVIQINKLRDYKKILARGPKKVDGSDTPILTSGDVALKQTQKVTGNRSISISIHIDEMIHEFNVKTTNITEGASKIAEKVTQTLLAAVNDSQVVAGQNS